MLNDAYQLDEEAGALKVRKNDGYTVAIVNDDDEGRAMLAGIKSRILFDGGTLFDNRTDEYVVGTVDQLMKKGR